MIRIGVLCPSEIAFRRFLPALMKISDFSYVGVSIAGKNDWSDSDISQDVLNNEIAKAQKFAHNYGGCVSNGYSSFLESDSIDAVYIPLPPALHFKWAKKALECGKHVFLEKPFTTSLCNTSELIRIAESKNLAVHENYMFQYHEQVTFIKNFIAHNYIGNIRLIRLAFGFPLRNTSDFRYTQKLGGGALLDCAGYPIKMASLLMSDGVKIITSNLNYIDGFEVDMYGSITMQDNDGLTAQIAFGMDNNYKCELEIWGSLGTLYNDRIFTPPDNFEPTIIINSNGNIVKHTLTPDDCFQKSIIHFYNCICENSLRNKNYKDILSQSKFVEQILGKESI